MFNLAELWGLRPDGSNPRRHIKKYPEKKRERYFSAGELQAIGRVLGEMEEERIELPSAIAAVRLLLVTGCRLGEIMTLRWVHVDLPSKLLRLPDSKTGAKEVHLGNAAIAVLKQITPADDNPFVIEGRNAGAHLTDLQPFWQRLRGRAGLKNARIARRYKEAREWIGFGVKACPGRQAVRDLEERFSYRKRVDWQNAFMPRLALRRASKHRRGSSVSGYSAADL